MNKNVTQIIELLINEEMLSGVYAISFVNEPATETDFMHFNKDTISKHITDIKLATIDEEKRMVVGPVMIPEKMIFRSNEDNESFYVHFSKDTIRKTAQRFMELGLQKDVTVEHKSDVDDVAFVETWVKESMEFDKSLIYGDDYKDLPIGTWFAMARVDNDDLWNDIKDGSVRGFSIEGRFVDMAIKHNADKNKNKDSDIQLLTNLLNIITEIDDSELE